MPNRCDLCQPSDKGASHRAAMHLPRALFARQDSLAQTSAGRGPQTHRCAPECHHREHRVHRDGWERKKGSYPDQNPFPSGLCGLCALCGETPDRAGGRQVPRESWLAPMFRRERGDPPRRLVSRITNCHLDKRRTRLTPVCRQGAWARISSSFSRLGGLARCRSNPAACARATSSGKA